MGEYGIAHGIFVANHNRRFFVQLCGALSLYPHSHKLRILLHYRKDLFPLFDPTVWKGCGTIRPLLSCQPRTWNALCEQACF